MQRWRSARRHCLCCILGKFDALLISMQVKHPSEALSPAYLAGRVGTLAFLSTDTLATDSTTVARTQA
jgi:hypothetical protein